MITIDGSEQEAKKAMEETDTSSEAMVKLEVEARENV